MLTIAATALGVDDLARATTFWAEALGYTVVDTSDRSAALRPPGDTGTPLYLHLSTTPVQQHPRVHLDLYAPDLPGRTAEIERLRHLGATGRRVGQLPARPGLRRPGRHRRNPTSTLDVLNRRTTAAT